MDDVFKALADPSRRELLDRLNADNGQTLGQLCEGLDMARQSVSKHLAVLESANLVTTLWQGREKLHYLNAEPINAIRDRWINRYDLGRLHALADLKTALEQPMSKAQFVYTSYIKSTPEQVWKALTEPAFTRAYWDLEFKTDWKRGSEMVWCQGEAVGVDPEQVVLEADPYNTLSYTWHTITPELARQHKWDDELLHSLQCEGRSKVTFTIEAQEKSVKLTVLHEDLDPVIAGMVSNGWPSVISRMKSLLETGSA